MWFTGLSGSGKSTIARAAADAAAALGWAVEVIDGDDLRQGVSSDLGFSREDRAKAVRRAAFLAGRLARNVDFVFVALIAPYLALRAEIASTLPGYCEVFVDAPLEICESRDPKGLYRRARLGHIKYLTGLDDPYEAPTSPHVVCMTVRETVQESTEKVLRFIIRTASATGHECAELLRRSIEAQPGLTAAEFSHRIGVTPRALSARLRRVGNSSFRSIRRQTLLAMAGCLLRGGSPVKEAAYRLGFGSSESFSRFYHRASGKRATGNPPDPAQRSAGKKAHQRKVCGGKA